MITAFFIYTSLLLSIVYFSYKKHTTETDFVIGGRSVNFWVTAISAQASDMSAWLFMAFPALIFSQGLFNAWIAISLVIGMFLNWHFVAPKLRVMTERYNSLTLSSYLEAHFQDKTGFIRILTGVLSLLFFIFYITAGFVALGLSFRFIFGLPYSWGVSAGALIAVLYTIFGGFITVAWTDLFQGIFLLAMIYVVPFSVLREPGSFSTIAQAALQKGISLKFLPDFSLQTLQGILFMLLSWGPGYFGQPHILTKFMGIKNAKDMPKSKYVGITWQILALTAAVSVGIAALGFFESPPKNDELIFILMAKSLLHPFAAGLVLCSILAATLSTCESQILVVATLLSEDFYKRLLRPKARSSELLIASRSCVILIVLIAYFPALYQISEIYSLVLYSWSGLGASFGPVILLSLYSKKITSQGAIAAILVGGTTAAVWPEINRLFSLKIPELAVGFTLGLLAARFFSSPRKKNRSIH